MLYVKGNTISMTRGDTAYLTIPITTSTGEEYTMGSEDILTLSVKESVDDETYVLQKEVIGTNAVHIEPKDTADLPFGKYKYDVQLTMANGDVFTIIEVSTFKLLPEVTCK